MALADGIQIYEEPSVQSETVGIVDNGKNVRVEETSGDDWVAVLAPLNGYAPTDKLAACPPPRFK